MSVNDLAQNEKLTLDIVIDRLQNKKSRKESVEIVSFEINALVSKSKMGKSHKRNSC